MRILVAGSFAAPPGQGGTTWAVLQYALGLRELGHKVLLIDPCEPERQVIDYFDMVVRSVDLVDGAALVHSNRSATGRCNYQWIARWAAGADVLINLAGVLRDDELVEPIPHRVYVDLDPAFTQIWHSGSGIDMGFAGHHTHATVGQLVGTNHCHVPTCGIDWTPTLPPLVLSEWAPSHLPATRGLTTVANWRSYGSVTWNGVHHGQKAHAMRQIMDLPRRVPGVRFEPALAIDNAETADLQSLHSNGWHRTDPKLAVGTPDRYRRFLAASVAEIGVAKSGYLVSRCGWFSDRSACYLACGRPVVAQDTGWPQVLPSGEGLLAFTSAEEAADAVGEVLGNYNRHSRSARALACDYFDSRVVLERLLGTGGPRLVTAGKRPEENPQ
jgi:hypothetical protein